ncbi:hypothetical protein I3843_09G116800 [Carya illinoinensis]|uniref:Transcription factor TCP2-like n=1 Tax=Carya illinoinensis TaxID=32201 RepID=A0A8T1PJH4_CARIL|nr:transcription factor TCP2-like [Carya illinoinensis]XP_042940786.1 transcription factor TCP2-like [Carya illinoinensis]XP_042940787.1 transcription factor TCP2-like [Carya illinoinensis]XP_042940788.1 transcription factor TCP2-like [Carya illinoinensis]XP_042940789.1 transcription factor TCP2-like [Carya illinoinensis]XP_042940790.1 transcription factor TCP2-like [Carya illinoinensis]XP_042940791.1 transcription factor TCP2-like [Carya illinoinensis]XP_042940792.1 transcription factor TCP
MEAEEIQQAPACKFPRVGNGRNDYSKIGSKGGSDHYPDDEEDVELRAGNVVPGSDAGGNANRLRGWNHSRIIRVSRASGGKDRHSKVWTSKGLRDRRVRLSVTTAIQFYDLQDRLGYDQPSKAVEWLIKAAADAIAELPSLNSAFPDTPKQLSDEKRASGGTEQGFDSAEVELDGDPNFQQNQSQHLSLSKSACSSTSETSKGSGLSLSRSEIRVKARERARERAAKEKEKENDSRVAQNVNHIPHNASFTELLTGGISSVNNNGTSPPGSTHQNPGGESNLFHKAAARQWPCSTPMDYFDSGLLGPSSRAHHSSGFSGQSHLGNSIPQAMTMSVPTFNISGDNHSELQHFSFVPDHLIPVAAATSQPGSAPVDYNLNFSISSSGLAGYNRGTLQSNSPSFFPHLQRFSPIDGPNVPFFMASTASASPPMENHHHHQFSPGFDGRLQLCYGDGSRHSDQKGKGKN